MCVSARRPSGSYTLTVAVPGSTLARAARSVLPIEYRRYAADRDESTRQAAQVEAAYSKHERRDAVPLHPDLAATLRSWLVGTENGALLWPGKWAKPFASAAMLRKDLEAARAAWIAEADTPEEVAARE